MALDDEEIVGAYERLKSTDKIAAESGMPLSTVAYRLRRILNSYPLLAVRLYDAGYRSRPAHSELLPAEWKVAREHKTNHPANMLRAISRLRQGLPVDNPQREREARAFETMLLDSGKVVDYDRRRGFQLVDRRPDDRDVIRLPEGASIPESFPEPPIAS